MKKRVLVAGIGNLFLGDDAFGIEVVRELLKRPVPEGVRVEDFGVRGYDLAFALTQDYDAVVLVDATPRGSAPGTLYVMELEWNAPEPVEDRAVDAHGLDPVRVLQLARSMRGALSVSDSRAVSESQPRGVGEMDAFPRLYLVGCEPATLEPQDSGFGLSDGVRSALPKAVAEIESLLTALTVDDPLVEPGRIAAATER